MRYHAKFRVRSGEIKTQLVNGECWADAVNHLLELPNVIEVCSVRNLRDVGFDEQVSLVESRCFNQKKSNWEKQTTTF